MAERLTKKDYQNALDVQDACNLSGVVRSFSEVILKVWAEARARGEGTEFVNSHPICRMYADKIMDLAARTGFAEAYRICQENS